MQERSFECLHLAECTTFIDIFGVRKVRRKVYGVLLHTCITSLVCQSAIRRIWPSRDQTIDTRRDGVKACSILAHTRKIATRSFESRSSTPAPNLWPSQRQALKTWQGSLHAACMPNIMRPWVL
jgi:hypothetical protein